MRLYTHKCLFTDKAKASRGGGKSVQYLALEGSSSKRALPDLFLKRGKEKQKKKKKQRLSHLATATPLNDK